VVGGQVWSEVSVFRRLRVVVCGIGLHGTDANIPQLIAVQVCLGVGQAVVVPASYRWIRYHFVEQERGLATGLYMTGTKIGPAIGTPLAAWLIGRYDWRLMVRPDRLGRTYLARALALVGHKR
jgi:ACS family D-galactonate transporter-like MFS transporter